MSRLAATLRLDVRLQGRNRLYLIVAVATLALASPLRASFTPDQLRFFMPLLALSGVTITTFFLVGVLLMLEREEGTLDVVLVSPLRPAEYLASKLLTLVTLALIESAFIVLVAFGVQTALAAPDRFGMLLAGGISAWFGVQAIVNLGGVTGVMPVTGLTLPFFSAGGSSLFVSMFAAGLLLSVARRVSRS